MISKKKEKFIKLANSRVNTILKRIDLIGNLSSKNNYEYTDRDVKKIFKALTDRISDAQARFSGKGKKDQEFNIGENHV